MEDRIVRKKMYKSGKNWVVASIVISTLALGAVNANADTVPASDAATTTTATNTSSSKEQTTDSTATSNADKDVATQASSEETTPEKMSASENSKVAESDSANSQAESIASKATETSATTTQATKSETKSTASSQTNTSATQSSAQSSKQKASATQSTPLPAKQNVSEDVSKVDTSNLENLAKNSEKAAMAYLKLNNTAKKIMAAAIKEDATLSLDNLTAEQIDALNKIKLTKTAASQLTMKDYASMAEKVVNRDQATQIPFFNAEKIKNMPGITTVDAEGPADAKPVALDIWDSWPVQNPQTGYVENWNGYQLIVSMMGVPHKSDSHLYLLYTKYGDNDFNHWKVAGSIFGYNLDPMTGHWSGSAMLNADGSIQLFYTNVLAQESNNQRVATVTVNLQQNNDGTISIKNLENDQILFEGDGSYYQTFDQWKDNREGNNPQMRDAHIVQDKKGDYYIVFESATGDKGTQPEGISNLYDWGRYGGDAAFNVKTLFKVLASQDMTNRAKVANSAMGLIKLDMTNTKLPKVQKIYEPVVQSVLSGDEIERPNVLELNGKYYLFIDARLNHATDTTLAQQTDWVVGDNVTMLGYVADKIDGNYVPLNGDGLVLGASVPSYWRTATYAYYAVKINPDNIPTDTVTINGVKYDKDYFVNHVLLVNAYMSNRGEVAGKGNNSTLSPSFLVLVNDDGTTKVLANSNTDQGVWNWTPSSPDASMNATQEQAKLPSETIRPALVTKENGKTYLYLGKTEILKGFQFVPSINTTAYFDPQTGEMQKGEVKIGNHWYNFSESDGAVLVGFQMVKDAKGNSKIAYYSDANFSHNAADYNENSKLAQRQQGEQLINGSWYHFDETTGAMSTGLTYLTDQKKTVFYAGDGKMQYGQQKIDGHWYNFVQGTGAMSTGLTYLADQKKTVYYNDKGQMQYGQQNINGKWYNFDTSSGAMMTGIVYIPSQNKLVYYNNQGQMQYGNQKVNGVTYSFDKSSGALKANGQIQIAGHWYFLVSNKPVVGLQKIVNQNKIVYYSPVNAQMQYGQQHINGKWYLFDKWSGAMKTGLQYISDQKKTVYYASNGQMQYGQQHINGHWYNFAQGTGAMSIGLTYLTDQKKTVYYANNGQMQYGQQRINGHWYLFDKWSGAMKTGLQYISDQKKTVYYNDNGQMQYGQQNINGKWYLFDKWSGAMKTGLQYISDQKKTVYYNAQGQMQYGQQNINGKWYLFDKWSGAMKTGLQYISDQKKTVYYNAQGQMQYGQQHINGHWYNFAQGSGAMSTGLTYLADQKKTVYYDENGQMQYGQVKVGDNQYYFNPTSGAMEKNVFKKNAQGQTVYFGENGQMKFGQQHINGKWYNFEKETGVMSTGLTYLADQKKTVYYNNQGQMQYGLQYVNGKWMQFDKSTGALLDE